MNSSFLRRIIAVGAILLVGTVALLPNEAFAGTCMQFCKRDVTALFPAGVLQPGEPPYTEVQLQSGAATCFTDSQCPNSEPTCSTGYTRAFIDEAIRFCNIITPVSTAGAPNPLHRLTAGLTWCSDLLSPSRAREDGRCLINRGGGVSDPQPRQQQNACSFTCERRTPLTPQAFPNAGACSNATACQTMCDTQCAALGAGSQCATNPQPICGDRGYGAAPNTGTSAPERTEAGQAFRCVYVCAGEDAPRNGNTCSNANDTATCTAQCNSACPRTGSGGTGCMGVTGGAQPANGSTAPRCAATQAPAPSVGGLTDTQQFEALNEAFPNLSVPVFIGNLIKTLLGVAGSLFFAMLVWGGIRWMTAGGEQANVKAAQTITRNAVIGVILIVLSYTIVTAFMQIVSQFAMGTS